MKGLQLPLGVQLSDTASFESYFAGPNAEAVAAVRRAAEPSAPPLLVGDRIGLHPVAVIFAVMAGGQLFGFTGVLLALPAAAVLAVVLRHAMARWRESDLYGQP